MKKGFVADYDYEFDEKHKTVSVTERGVAKAEKFLGIDHLYRAENGPLVNHLIQALRAESLYKRDVDYAVVDGEVKIIDEFTGRILDGRRWSEGLHQAVEAKEGVRVQEENQTLATITLQNYFRMYDKLAGMTGTALTEATEFMKIYKLPVVQIPTNRPMVRKDENDQVFKTKDGKWRAVAREIEARHEKGQPVLVGTISVEVSELLGSELDKRGIKHTVLNAKPEYAEKEGETIAEAGRPGAVTIATNMAGRGVDIKLGGNRRAPDAARARQARPQARRPRLRRALRRDAARRSRRASRRPARQVLEAGGLYIVGTERHESRRIDNQLRGRSGRQGDPGESRFFLSAEDDLVRLFAGDRIYRILDRLGPTSEEGEEEPIEAKMLSKQIENAQRKVEEQNYLIRKRVLEYDDVMNQQREIVYKYRDEVLEGRDMGSVAREQVAEVIARLVDEYTPGDYIEEWDLEGMWVQLDQIFHVDFGPEELDRESIDRDELKRLLTEDSHKLYDEREEELGEELTRALERYLLLQIIDQRWREHLYDMDYLREGIHLRGFAQIDPLVAYKNEGFSLFQDLMNTIWSDFARMIYNVEVEVEGENGQSAAAAPRTRPATPRSPTRAARSTTSPAPTAARATASRTRSPSPRSWSSAGSTRTSRSGATIRAGAGRARSSRSATAPRTRRGTSSRLADRRSDRVDGHLQHAEAGDHDRGGRHDAPDACLARAQPEHDRGDGERQADPEAAEREVPRPGRAGDGEYGEQQGEAGSRGARGDVDSGAVCGGGHRSARQRDRVVRALAVLLCDEHAAGIRVGRRPARDRARARRRADVEGALPAHRPVTEHERPVAGDVGLGEVARAHGRRAHRVVLADDLARRVDDAVGEHDHVAERVRVLRLHLRVADVLERGALLELREADGAAALRRGAGAGHGGGGERPEGDGRGEPGDAVSGGGHGASIRPQRPPVVRASTGPSEC